MKVRHLALAASVLATAAAPAAQAAPALQDTAKLREGMSAWGILGHETALQAIAAANDGTRVSGTPGFDRSADYVARRAERAGLKVTRQEFEYEIGGDTLAGDVVQPRLVTVGRDGAKVYKAGAFGAFFGGDFGTAVGSGKGDVFGRLWAVDLDIPPSPGATRSTSGCEPEDFAGMPAGSVALIQRGTCGFAVKIANAKAAGAGALVIMNEGNPGREGPLFLGVTAAAGEYETLPILTTPFATGADLAGDVRSGATGKWARVKAEWFDGTRTTSNVIAETPRGNADNVIVVGAHLDSVGVGPGINDNGSGSAGILEIAEQLRRSRLQNKLRFMWYGAEEAGLIGSQFYVDTLPDAERARIGAMLNYDMIGSPNFVRFVYDGDLSEGPPGPTGPTPEAQPGSAIIEDIFLDYFAAKGLATEPTGFDGRSDYGPFITAGIPAGGLFTGAEGIKTEEEAAIYGGTAGEQYDPCYHLSCDTIGNLSLTALEQMGDAAAHATYVLAQSPKLPRGAAAPAAALRRSGAATTDERREQARAALVRDR